MKKQKQKQLKAYLKYSSLTTQMAVIIFVGSFFGDYLDKTINLTQPIFTIVFSLSSIFLALYYVLRDFK